jgi:hypothetical protein
VDQRAAAGARPTIIPLVVAWAAVLKDFVAAAVLEEVVIFAAGTVQIMRIIAE